jgi:hypothetical protein
MQLMDHLGRSCEAPVWKLLVDCHTHRRFIKRRDYKTDERIEKIALGSSITTIQTMMTRSQIVKAMFI